MNVARHRHASRCAIAIALAGAIALVGCGGGDDPVVDPAGTTPPSAPDATDGDAGGGSSTETPEGPNATVAPGLPEEFAGSIGPIDVLGDSLPALEATDITSDPAIGETVPILVGEDYDGNPVRIDPAAAGPTMVVFLAHWCPHCNAEVPRINELRDDGRFPDWLTVVAVSTAVNPGRPNFPPGDWITDMDWTYPVIADGIDLQRDPPTFIAADAYGVSAFPFVTLVDADGKVAARWSGESTPDEIVERVTTYLG